MAWLHMHHRVQDFNKWKEAFDKTAEYKRHQGWKQYRIYQVAGDRNDLVVMEQFTSLEQTRNYAQSDFLRDYLKVAGVLAPVETLLLEGLEEGRA
jgi:quinol monooxygenase YgiN